MKEVLTKIKRILISKKTLIYFLSFIIPILIMVGFVIYNQKIMNYDFFMKGENYLSADMGNQYNALYNYIRNVFLGKDSIFYSFHNSLGGNMASTIGYYLSSPFNFLYIFVKRANIPLMTYIIYVLKISLCSLFMNIYISHKFGNRYSNLIFSLTYAFMGFVIVYFFNNMWLDVIYMTPLVIMGIDKLIDGKPLMYIITLSLSIIFNFYITYMLCIFCVIYFIYELFIRYSIKDFKSYKRIILRFIISSLLAGGLSAFFLIPVLLDLRNSMRTSTDSSLFNLQFNISNWSSSMFSKILIGSNSRSVMLGRKSPVIYISLFSLILSYLYFCNEKIKRKEKILSLIIIIFFIVSFTIPHLQYIWQGFSFPNGYIDRFSFLYCFFLILLAAKCFYNKSHIKIIWFILFLILFLLSCYSIGKFEFKYLDQEKIIVNIIVIILYVIILFFYFNVFKKSRFIILLIFLIVIGELIYNYKKSMVLLNDSNFGKYYKSACKEFNNMEDRFYRIDGSYYATLLDSFACDYYDFTTALSTSNKDLYNFYYNNGGSVTKINLFNDNESIPILNSLMGIKYLINNKELESSTYEYYKKIKSDNIFGVGGYAHIYKNPEALSLGYIIDNNFEKNLKINKRSGFDNLNNLVNSMTGNKYNILQKINKETIKKGSLYKYYIDKNNPYLYINVDYEMAINLGIRYNIFVDDINIFTSIDSNLGNYKFKNDYYKKDITIRIDNKSEYDIYDIDLYYFDVDKYKEAINDLKKYQLENINIKGNELNGNIKLDKDGLLFMSIPYDKGWNIYVDGKKVPYKKLANTFIGINLKKGQHKIKMKFYPKGLIIGLFISSISFILTILYIKVLLPKSIKNR